MSLTLVLMDSFLEFEELPPMPPVATVRYSGTFYLSGAGGDIGMGGWDNHQSEDLIIV